MLNIIWSSFFLIGAVVGLYQIIVLGNGEVFSEMMKATFEMSKVGFELSLGLTGVMAFWLGIMKIGENGGMIELLNKFFSPLFKKFFPSIPDNHPAIGSMMLNIAANMLGIDNAATPFGLKAMKELEEINPKKGTASDAQIMFLVINTSAVTIIPISIFTYLYKLGYTNPTEVFFPILIATFASTLVGVSVTAIIQKIDIIKNGLIWVLLGAGALLFSLMYVLKQLPPEQLKQISFVASNIVIFSVIILFITKALIRKVNVYDSFIIGAKEGFQVAISIIPYLIAMLVGVGVFRASGALDVLIEGIRVAAVATSSGLHYIGAISEPMTNFAFVDALPTAFMKPLSGSGARAIMVETIQTHGVDALVSKIVATIQGSTETTFYILAVYFGSVKISKTRYAVGVGLLADFVGVFTAIVVSYIFFA